jgi:hypothetical protein
MRKTFIALIVLVLVLSLAPLAVFARPAAQFAGCADEEGMLYGAKLRATQLNGFTMDVVVVGVDGFDPELTILNAEGEVVVCNADSDDAAEIEVHLPTVDAGPSEGSASASVRVPGDQGRLDYDIIVTSADGQPGEFVLIWSGAEVFGADNVDQFVYGTNEGMAEQEVPVNVYLANLTEGDSAYSPSLTVGYGEDFSITCAQSSSDSQCDGDHDDLGELNAEGQPAFSIVRLDGTVATLNGNDSMIKLAAGGGAADFNIDTASYQAATFGPYWLIIHSGVGNPGDGSAPAEAEATEAAG